MGIAYLVVIITSSLESLLVSPALCALLLPNVKITRREPWLARMCKSIYGRCLKFSFNSPLLIIGTALALTVASIVVIPSFGRLFLPEFQEQTMVNTLSLYPVVPFLYYPSRADYRTSIARRSRFKFIQTRAGRAAGDADAAGVNLATSISN